MNVASKLARIQVSDPEGKPLELGTLWRDQPVVLAFVRHFG